MRAIIYTLSILMLITSCHSIDRMVESGNYDEALNYSIDKLAGAKKKKTKYVKGLERAYAELNRRDNAKIDYLMNMNNVTKWESIYEIYTKLERRQEAISGLLPLISEDGYVADIPIKSYVLLKAEMRDKSNEAFYNEALNTLNEAKRLKSKLLARQAFNYFERLERWNADYKNTVVLKMEARELGMVHIAIDVKNESKSPISELVSNRIENLNVRKFNNTWEVYHLFDERKTYDKYVVVSLSNIEFGAEKEHSNNYELSAIVEEGLEYLYDKNGKVVKDSLGREITIPRKVITKAWVSEIFRGKESRAFGRVALYDEVRSLPSANIPLTVIHRFNDSALTFVGDKRALSDDICNRLDDHLMAFPSDYDSARILGDYLVNAVENAIRDLRLNLS